MVVRKIKAAGEPTDKFGKAGHQAEQQMAFYLQRAFGEAKDVHVFNDLRVVRNGEVAQIDHLVLHPFGLVLIESKSVTGTIEVNAKGEFVRTFGRRRQGMKSPLVQVAMQRRLLQTLLNEHKEQLRRKTMMGLVQAEFSDPRFTEFVAISDRGEIKRKGCDPPQLVKADRVAAEIEQLIRRFARATGVGGFMRYVLADKKTEEEEFKDILRPFTTEETTATAAFLLEQHQEPAGHVEPKAPPEPPPLPSPPAPHVPPKVSTAATCKHCEGKELEIRHGRYGYYFKCLDCEKNTPIDFTCPDCGKRARIRKSGPQFTRQCESCGSQSHFFTNPSMKEQRPSETQANRQT